MAVTVNKVKNALRSVSSLRRHRMMKYTMLMWTTIRGRSNVSRIKCRTVIILADAPLGYTSGKGSRLEKSAEIKCIG
ncbi:hypothetical protein AAVH_23665 [Aphelenchoides avenae]|nr:hypothetical protein AAVH_23665 [Aphelenchus avenae]